MLLITWIGVLKIEAILAYLQEKYSPSSRDFVMFFKLWVFFSLKYIDGERDLRQKLCNTSLNFHQVIIRFKYFGSDKLIYKSKLCHISLGNNVWMFLKFSQQNYVFFVDFFTKMQMIFHIFKAAIILQCNVTHP